MSNLARLKKINPYIFAVNNDVIEKALDDHGIAERITKAFSAASDMHMEILGIDKDFLPEAITRKTREYTEKGVQDFRDALAAEVSKARGKLGEMADRVKKHVDKKKPEKSDIQQLLDHFKNQEIRSRLANLPTDKKMEFLKKAVEQNDFTVLNAIESDPAGFLSDWPDWLLRPAREARERELLADLDEGTRNGFEVWDNVVEILQRWEATAPDIAESIITGEKRVHDDESDSMLDWSAEQKAKYIGEHGLAAFEKKLINDRLAKKPNPYNDWKSKNEKRDDAEKMAERDAQDAPDGEIVETTHVESGTV